MPKPFNIGRRTTRIEPGAGLNRGDVVIVATGGGFGGKPRPALVLQSDAIRTGTAIVALFTSQLRHADPIRPSFTASPQNGLLRQSELMVDILVTAQRDEIGKVVGRLDRDDLRRAEQALLAILGFAASPDGPR